jgi:hypothetical protein
MHDWPARKTISSETLPFDSLNNFKMVAREESRPGNCFALLIACCWWTVMSASPQHHTYISAVLSSRNETAP